VPTDLALAAAAAEVLLHLSERYGCGVLVMVLDLSDVLRWYV
jgi:hypothetical protein